jgi:hypothetical protein
VDPEFIAEGIGWIIKTALILSLFAMIFIVFLGVWNDFHGKEKNQATVPIHQIDANDSFRKFRDRLDMQLAEAEYSRLKQKALRRTLKRKRPPLHKRIRY